MTVPVSVLRCPDCWQVLLIVMDPYDPGLPDEIADKVDAHIRRGRCPVLDGDGRS